jgi:glucose-6-phosphate dehydrogenase assembly protein OpcA
MAQQHGTMRTRSCHQEEIEELPLAAKLHTVVVHTVELPATPAEVWWQETPSQRLPKSMAHAMGKWQVSTGCAIGRF